MATELNATQVLAAATQILGDSGYIAADLPMGESSARFSSRFFEDRYGIVSVCVFETWSSLLEEWPAAQGELVALISETLRRPEPKAWEGYLVLMTTALMPEGDRTSINRLRADTNRVRKLVTSGDDLATLEDIRTFLLPLVPLELDASLARQEDLLQSLPSLLLEHGVQTEVTQRVLEAFADNESIFKRLHDAGSAS
jgi:hypothetical protein